MSKKINSVAVVAASVLAIGITVGPAQAASKGTARMIERLDTDDSGTISLQEYLTARSARIERVFDRRDKDDDGTITEEEFGPGNSGDNRSIRAQMQQCIRVALGGDVKPTWEEWLAEVDTNLDGAVDLGEYTTDAEAKIAETFASIDTDASGDITAAEIDAARIARRTERQQRNAERRAAREMCAEQLGIDLKKKRGNKRPKR